MFIKTTSHSLNSLKNMNKYDVNELPIISKPEQNFAL